MFLGVQDAAGERLGLLIYPFRMTDRVIHNRPSDEVRGQIRYGGEESWDQEHPVGFDIAGVDTTLILGIDLSRGLLLGLQPALYDPLPMGISFYAKSSEMAAAGKAGWHVWERVNRPGTRRSAPRASGGLETLVAFAPGRLLDYVRFERQATDAGLDQPLRFAAARAAASSPAGSGDRGGTHLLEREFGLTSMEIMQIIATRKRLEVAVRGGVAEHHLARLLSEEPTVARSVILDVDAQHDFDVLLADGRALRVECKNASPHRYASGDFRVEVQKTRASRNDPASRYYRIDQFDVVAACLFSPTGRWEFRFRSTRDLAAHTSYPDRLAPMQRVDGGWSRSLAELA